MAYLEIAIGITIMYLPYCRNIMTPEIFKYWEISQIIKPDARRPARAWFLRIASVCECLYVYMCVCPPRGY